MMDIGTDNHENSEMAIRIRRMRTLPAVLITLAAITVLGFTDYVVGSELSFSIYYLLPISVAVFFNGKTLGIVSSFLCAFMWLAADIASGLVYTSILYPIWNAMVRLGYFLLHTFILNRLLITINLVKKLSLHDPLTSAANWRFFEEYGLKIVKAAARNNRPVTIAYIDLDNFKGLNDAFGHDTGDEALKVIAAVILGQIRPNDMLARLGGDEFAVLLTEIDYAGAVEALQRIVQKLNESMHSRKWNVTFSIGAVTFNILTSSLGQMVKRVDELMYTVKKNGKNNIIHLQWPERQPA